MPLPLKPKRNALHGAWGPAVLVAGAGLCLLGMGLTASVAPPKQQDDIKVLLAERQGAARYGPVLQEAWRDFQITKMHAARAAFRGVSQAGDATEAERVQALFGMGLSYALASAPSRADVEKARDCFGRIVEEHADNAVAAWSLIELAKLEDLKTPSGRAAARKYLVQLQRKYPDSLAVHEGALRLADLYFREMASAENARGAEILEEHLRKYPDNPLASTMHFRLAYWYEQVRRDYSRGLEHAVKLGEMRMCDPYRWGMQYWNVAQTYRLRMHQPEKALYWYRKIMDECPHSRLRLSARQMIAQLQAAEKTDTAQAVKNDAPKKHPN